MFNGKTIPFIYIFSFLFSFWEKPQKNFPSCFEVFFFLQCNFTFDIKIWIRFLLRCVGFVGTYMKISAEFQEVLISCENFFVHFDCASLCIVWISDSNVIIIDFQINPLIDDVFVKNAAEFFTRKFVIFAVLGRWKLTHETVLMREWRDFRANDFRMKLAVWNALDVIVVDEPNRAISIKHFYDRGSVEAWKIEKFNLSS